MDTQLCPWDALSEGSEPPLSILVHVACVLCHHLFPIPRLLHCGRCFLIQHSPSRATQRFERFCAPRALSPAASSALGNDKIMVVVDNTNKWLQNKTLLLHFLLYGMVEYCPLNPMKRFSLQNDNPTMDIEDTEMGKLVYHRDIKPLTGIFVIKGTTLP